MIVGNYFIFGEEPTNADICLFSVLIQFFEGPFLNIPILDYFFRLKGSSNNIGSTSQVYNQKGKGKEIIQNEEELNGFKYNNGEIPNGIEKDEIEEEKEEIDKNKGLKIVFEDDRINILFNFVQNMKRKLGFNKESDWQNLRESPWKLNYEPEDFSQKRYIGPFQIETDELLGINKLLFYERITDLWSLITRKKKISKKIKEINYGKKL
uniref:Glutathione S-transferase n=1 Tax=Meloidogyne incognita TaxID=6306 RepID=A0A914NJH0_MELIC